MRWFFTLALLLAWPAACVQAQSPPPAPLPADLRVTLDGGAPILHWTSRGPTTLRSEYSTNLQAWIFNDESDMGLAAGLTNTVEIHALFLTPQRYFRLIPPQVPPAIFEDLVDQAPSAGQPFSLKVQRVGDLPIIDRWYRDGRLVTTVTNERIARLEGQTLGGSYQLVMANPWGAATSQVAQVTYLPPVLPHFAQVPPDRTYKAGNFFSLRFISYGDVPLTSIAYHDGVALFTNSVTLSEQPSDFTLIQRKLGGAYWVVTSNPWGSATSRVVNITIDPDGIPPTFTGQPGDRTLAAGQRVDLVAAVTGGAPLVERWYRDSVPVATYEDDDSNNYYGSFSEFVPAGTYQYQVVVSNQWGQATSRTAVVTVRPPSPPRIFSDPSDLSVGGESAFALSARVESEKPFVSCWYREGRLLSTATNDGGGVVTVTLSPQWIAGLYRVVASNALGQATSHDAIVSVNSGPTSLHASCLAGSLSMRSPHQMSCREFISCGWRLTRPTWTSTSSAPETVPAPTPISALTRPVARSPSTTPTRPPRP